MSIVNPPLPTQYGAWQDWAAALIRALSPEQQGQTAPQIITNADVEQAVETDPGNIRDALEISAANTPNDAAGELTSTNVQAALEELQADVSSREPAIAAGTVSQYWRGDKTWVDFPALFLGTDMVTFLAASTDLVFDSGIGDSTLPLPSWAIDFAAGSSLTDWTDIDNFLLDVGDSSDY